MVISLKRFRAPVMGLLILATENTPLEGWKIKSIDYVPEDFLCHPLHHWDYDAKSLIGIVYKNWYGMIDEIEKIEMDDSVIHVYAVGDGNKYRFDFVRITNGDDALLHEYTQQNGKWEEVNLLKEENQVYKFSILNPNLNHIEEDYENRKIFLLKHHIAVWDVLKSCDREGSSDSKIDNPVPNDFETFFNRYPDIKVVFFNGSKSEELLKKMVAGKIQLKEGLLFYRLPSTSPANAMGFKYKLEQWKAALPHLGIIQQYFP